VKKTSDPPGFAVWLLSKRLPTEWRDFVLGDLEEEFASRRGASPIGARAWFWWQAIRCLAAPPRARPDPTKSRGRESPSLLPFDAFVRDVRYAFRTMRRQKTFTALAVLCLALGIGANTTIFSLMDSILFRELPVEAPDELVILQWTARVPVEGVPWAVPTRGGLVAVESGLRGDSWPYPMFASFNESSELFTEVFGSQPVSQLRVDDGDTPMADGLYVTGNFFRALGLGAQAGRLLLDDDDRFDAPPAVVLSSAFGTERFGSPEAAVGRSIRINDVAFTVVGIAPPSFLGLDPERPPSFYLPLHSGPLLVAASPRLALPGGEGPAAATLVGNTLAMYENPRFHWVSAWARLRPGIALEQVEAKLRPQFDQFFAANVPDQALLRNAPRLQVATGTAGLDGMRRNYGETLLVLFAMVVVILIVACASIASLLLERATARRREMAVRMSLGAGRLSVIRQLLTESAVLALIGGAAGVVLSIAGMRALSTLLAAGGDGALFRAELNWAVLGVTLGVTLLTGVLFGLAPAVHATRVTVSSALKGSRSAPAGEARKGRVAFGQVLVVAQIALSLVLLIGASLFAVTLMNLRTAELGFNQEGLLLANVDATRAGFEGNAVKAFYSRLRERVRQVPGVDNASLSWTVLAGGGPFTSSATVPGASTQATDINVQVVGHSFFETMQIEILAGRSISDFEVDASEAVAVVDRSFAETFFPGGDAVGRTIDVQGEGQLRIVGVSENARQDVVRGDARPVVYYTYMWDPHALFSLVLEVRTQGDPLAYANTMRAIVRELHPEVRLTGIRTQAANTDRTISREILFARLSNTFAVLALVIACAGLYGTVSYAMARQTPETGIRMALGATRGLVLRHALRQVLGLGLAGLAIGVPAALFAARYIETFLWGVAAHDPLILGGAALVVLAAVIAAGYAPANRASKIDPMAALRSE
jgi:macrolide transport system ATP-binding/permease protein